MAEQYRAADANTQPLAVSERLHFLDVARGFAMLGIILVNYFLIAMPSRFFMQGEGDVWNSAVQLFAEGKFYPLFSFLFGVGFIIFMERAHQRFESPRLLFARRLTFLLIFGLLHITLIWSGDILTYYAVAGFILLLFYQCRPRTLLIWSGVLLLVHLLMPLAMMFSFSSFKGKDFPGKDVFLQPKPGADSYLASIGDRITGTIGKFATSPSMVLSMLLMFFLGMYFFKKGYFRDMESKVRQWTQLWIYSACAFAITLAGNIISTLSGQDMWMGGNNVFTFLNQLSGIAGCMFYLSTLAMLYLYSTKLRKGLMLMAQVGRMSLTCYLLHSAIGTFLFLDYGLGLGKQLQPVGIVAISFGVYAFFIVFSTLWLRRFRLGPMEWLWRRLTYGSFKASAPKAIPIPNGQK